MAAANQALRDATGSLDLVTAESIARPVRAPRQQRHPRRPPDRRARRDDRRVRARRVARGDRRTALPPDGLPARPEPAATRDRRRDARVAGAPDDRARRDLPGRPAVRDARLVLRPGHRRGPAARAARLDPRGPRLRDAPADPRRHPGGPAAGAASRSAPSARRMRGGSGMPPPRRSGTNAARASGARGTGSATSPTRIGTRRSGPSPSSVTRSPAASTAGSTRRRTPITACSRGTSPGSGRAGPIDDAGSRRPSSRGCSSCSASAA